MGRLRTVAQAHTIIAASTARSPARDPPPRAPVAVTSSAPEKATPRPIAPERVMRSRPASRLSSVVQSGPVAMMSAVLLALVASIPHRNMTW